jgi:hypothetical protein
LQRLTSLISEWHYRRREGAVCHCLYLLFRSAPFYTLSQANPRRFLEELIASTRISSREMRVGKGVLMKKQVFRERECIHQDDGVEGEYYNGVFYVQALQRLPVDVALQIASKVEPFFWSDAPEIVVWLCRNCATEVGVAESPRAITQPARRARMN